MRRFIHCATGLVLLLILIGQGAAMVSIAHQPECWSHCIDFLHAERGWVFLAGIVLLALVTVYLITGVRRRPAGEEYLAFNNNGATVSILLRAVNEFIGKIADEFAAIVSMKPVVRTRRRGRSLDIDLALRVKAGTQLPELCQMLQDRVRESLQTNLGLTDIKSIRVQVKDIVGDAPPTDDVSIPLED